MDTWFASQTAINPVSKVWTVSVGWWRGCGRGGSGVERGMGTEAGLVLRDEHPRASSGTDVHTKRWVEQKAKVQQKRKSNLQTEAARTGSPQKPTMECELAIDWVIQHSTTQTGGPTGCTPVVDTKPNTPSRLAFQTDACFTHVIEASCCDHSIHGGTVLIREASPRTE